MFSSIGIGSLDFKRDREPRTHWSGSYYVEFYIILCRENKNYGKVTEGFEVLRMMAIIGVHFAAQTQTSWPWIDTELQRHYRIYKHRRSRR